MSYLPDQPRNYDLRPTLSVPEGRRWAGPEAWARLARAAEERGAPLVVDCYPGTDVARLLGEAAAALPRWRIVDVEQAALETAELDRLLGPWLTDDRVFGVLGAHTVEEFYDPGRLAALRGELARSGARTVVIGWGASLAVEDPRAVVVLAELARWEIQLRYRRGLANWHADNAGANLLAKYKRGFFVEWRAADRHKRALFGRADFVAETCAGELVLIDAGTFAAAMRRASSGPVRVVPYFDPGVWGGQWMKEVLGLDPAVEQYAWCFDCVPEENSLLLQVPAGEGGSAGTVELPALDVVLSRPRELLGELTYARFGAEFPIRFDLLDTMEGGNLSLQVHPLTDYIRQRFAMGYTQDESYYLLDAAPDAVVYLGLTEEAEPEAMFADLRTAQAGGPEPAVERYVNAFPARRHDHFLIPAGTPHCSGRNSMVLEVSATPYIFTFKMWDWGRVGLDGQPRPIHLDHAERNVVWERRPEWTRRELVDRVETVGAGEGWVEERTGLHELEFIETRRHWFSAPVAHDTAGTVNVLNLVEGAEAIVESPTMAFEPFVVHYAETFIVPAAVGPYTIAPHGASLASVRAGGRLGTLKAYVRGTEVAPRPLYITPGRVHSEPIQP